MAAGLGFKDFTTGEVLTAADVDGYLMQGIWVFADSAARDAAVTSPQEGNFAFLKDTNTTTYYTGSAWTNLDTTGMVNPMTTTGDTIYSSSGSTPARLGIGSTGQVLTVAGGVPSWATPSSGSLTLLSTTSFSTQTTSVTGISTAYTDLVCWIRAPRFTNQNKLYIYPNGSANSSYSLTVANSTVGQNTEVTTEAGVTTTAGNTQAGLYFEFRNYADTTYGKPFFGFGNTKASTVQSFMAAGFVPTASAITQLDFYAEGGGNSWTGGQVLIYGRK